MVRDGYSIEEVKDQARFMLEATGFDGFYADRGSAEKVLLRKNNAIQEALMTWRRKSSKSF